MTKTSHLLPLSLALSAALLLGACSRDAPAPAQSPSGKAGATAVGKVAVARGIIDVEGGLIALAPPEVRPMPSSAAPSSQSGGSPFSAQTIAPTMGIRSSTITRGFVSSK